MLSLHLYRFKTEAIEIDRLLAEYKLGKRNFRGVDLAQTSFSDINLTPNKGENN